MPGALRYVWIHNFGTTEAQETAVGRLTKSLRLLRIHKPDLQCSMATYQLEGSAAHQTVSEHGDGPLDSWYSYDTTKQLGRHTPTNSLVERQSSIKPSAPSPQVPIMLPSSPTDRQAHDRCDETEDHASRSPHRKIRRIAIEQTVDDHDVSGTIINVPSTSQGAAHPSRYELRRGTRRPSC